MRHLMDLTGARFGRLTVIREAQRTEQPRIRRRWECLCDCGNIVVVGHGDLRRVGEKATRSCGCLRSRRGTDHPLSKHNGSDTRLYEIWSGMRKRCRNPRYKSYKNYGGRGIFVCERWDVSFAAFRDDMGDPPVGMTLDRINNDGPYSPENCRWATKKQQANNTRTNRRISFQGETLHLNEWATRLNMAPSTLCMRLKRLPVAKAMTQLKKRSVR